MEGCASPPTQISQEGEEEETQSEKIYTTNIHVTEHQQQQQEEGEGKELWNEDQSVAPGEFVLLLCVVRPLDSCVSADISEGSYWQHSHTAGLGPFLFLRAQRVMDVDGNLAFTIKPPLSIPSSSAILQLLMISLAGRTTPALLQLQCVQVLSLRRQASYDDSFTSPTESDACGMGSVLLLRRDGVIVTPACEQTVESNKGEVGDGEKLEVTMNTKELLLFLRDVSRWNVRLLQECGVLVNGRLTCHCVKKSHHLQKQRVELIIRAVCYLQQQYQEKDMNEMSLTSIFLGWAQRMYNTLLASSSHLSNEETNSNTVGSVGTNTHVNTNDTTKGELIRLEPLLIHTPAVSGDIPRVGAGENINTANLPPQLQATHLLSPNYFIATPSSEVDSSMKEGFSGEAVLQQEQEELQQHKKKHPCEDVRSNVQNRNPLGSKSGRHSSLASFCDKVILEGFAIQKLHQEAEKEENIFFSSSSAHVLHGEALGVSNALGCHGGPPTGAIPPPDMTASIHTDRSEASEQTPRCANIPVCDINKNSTSKNYERCSSGSFLPNLIHRLVVRNEFSPKSRDACQFSKIAQGDIFPSEHMLKKADLLRPHLCEPLIVWLYDLEPQQLLSMSESPSFMYTSSVSGIYSQRGHPCTLLITEADIILLSAFGDGQRRRRKRSCLNHPGAVSESSTSEVCTPLMPADATTWRRNSSVGKSNTKSSSGVGPTIGSYSSNSNGNSRSSRTGGRSFSISNNNSSNSKRRRKGKRRGKRSKKGNCMRSSGKSKGSADDNSCESLSQVQHTLVIPRISLMEVQPGVKPGDGVTTVLRLQTRSCRRLWLDFKDESKLRKVQSELLSGVKSFSGNSFLASAQRPWRMMALALVAADVLPTPHTPFYQQVLRNLMVAFADVEASRMEQQQQQEEEEEETNDWWLYSADEEYVRQGIPARQWRLSNVNRHCTHFPTYPSRFVVPNGMSDEALLTSGALRMKRRVEALSFYYAPTGGGVVRTAQLTTASAFLPSSPEVNTIDVYSRAAGMRLHLLDLRSPIGAIGNSLCGGGFTLRGDSRFCSLVNIHVVRNAYNALCAEVLDSNPALPTVLRSIAAITTSTRKFSGGSSNQSFQTTTAVGLLSSSSQQQQHQHRLCRAARAWMQHIAALFHTAGDAARHVAGVPDEDAIPPAAVGYPGTVMAATTKISTPVAGDRAMQGSPTIYVWMRGFSPIPFGGGTKRNGCVKSLLPYRPPSYAPLQSRKTARLVMVNCSDGWDRTPQVCALTQLLLDPYFRTVEGFITLIEKEFIAFGHPCITRSSTLRGHGDVDRSNQNHHNGNDANNNNNNNSNNNNELPKEAGDDSAAVNVSDDSMSSPILLQFLDAVRQLRQIYPHCFEFTEAFLLLLVDLMHAGTVGTFAVNCERDVRHWKVEQRTLSLGQFCAVLFATTIQTEREGERGTGVHGSGAMGSNSSINCSQHNAEWTEDVLTVNENEDSVEDDDDYDDDDNNSDSVSNSSSGNNTAAGTDSDHHETYANITGTDTIRNTAANDSSGAPLSATPTFVPLQRFYKVCGGGATLPDAGWSTPDSYFNTSIDTMSGNTKPRRLHISRDAMLHSGLINPHFSLADNKHVIGPLLDGVRVSELTPWDGFFLRYSYWSEWRSKLRCFSECSPHTLYATAASSVGMNVVDSTSTPHYSEPRREEKVEDHQQHSQQHYPYDEGREMAMKRRPSSTTSVARMNSVNVSRSGAHTTTSIAPPRGILIGAGNNNNNKNVNTGMLHTERGNGGRVFPRTLPRAASYGAMSESQSPLHPKQQRQQLTSPPARQASRGKGYGTLLDELDQAFTE